jgi:hypothetical protein
MGDLEKTSREKLIQIASDIEFENDFGQTPIGLGHITKNQSVIIVCSLVGAFVGTAIAGVPLAVVVLAAGLNDILSINKRDLVQAETEEPEAIDVEASEVEANEPSEPKQLSSAASPADPPAPPETPTPDKPQGQSQELSLTIGSPARKILPPFDRDRIVDETKGLMIIGDMGAAKTCVAQYIANGFSGYGIIIFDPHGKTDWGNAYVISKMGAIYEQMRILLALLENGDETPLLIICDEWLEIRGDRRNKKGSEYAGLADDFIRLFSTKPRKFNKLAAFVLHSPNVEAAGVDSFLRENYLKIYLGRIAKKEFPQIQDCAYPCVVEDEQQVHPTHGHHSEFKPKGKVPRNLEPLSSAPIPIPLAYMDGALVKVCNRGWSDGQLRLTMTNIRNQLEMLYRDTSDTGTDTKKEAEKNPDTSGSDDTGTDTGNSDTGDTVDTTGVSGISPDTSNTGSAGIGSKSDTEGDTADTADITGVSGDGSDTPDTEGDTAPVAHRLPEAQLVSLIKSMTAAGMKQTQIICSLWEVEKNKAGWKAAYARFKELMGE